MKSGKVSDTVLKRSVLKVIREANREVPTPRVGGGAGELLLSGESCSRKKELLYETIQTVIGEEELTAYLAAVRCLHSLAVKKAVPISAELALTIPESLDEREMRKGIEAFCSFLSRNGIPVTGGHTAVSKAVLQPVASVTMLGHGTKRQVPESFLSLDVVMTGHCAMTGAALLAHRFERELSEHFQKRLPMQAKGFLEEAEKCNEAYDNMDTEVCYSHAAAEGGIFGALWELAEYTECGLDINLPEIPIHQETVEICEYFDINPYQLLTTGCHLYLAKNGFHLCEELKKRGATAAVIGRTVAGLDRAVRTGDEVRYLEPNRVEEYERLKKERNF